MLLHYANNTLVIITKPDIVVIDIGRVQFHFDTYIDCGRNLLWIIIDTNY